MSTNFKTTLETRRENMRAQNDRRNQFSGSGIPGDSVGLRSTVLYNDDQRAQQHDSSLIPANSQFQGLKNNFLYFIINLFYSIEQHIKCSVTLLKKNLKPCSSPWVMVSEILRLPDKDSARSGTLLFILLSRELTEMPATGSAASTPPPNEGLAAGGTGATSVVAASPPAATAS